MKEKDYATGFSKGFQEGQNAVKSKILKLLEEIKEPEDDC